MAKKSTAARQANAARRPQTAAKAPDVALVRAPKPDGATSRQTTPSDASRQSFAVANKPKAAPSAERPKALAAPKPAKPATASAESVVARQQAAKAQAVRIERAKSARRARAANLITPEHYTYVLKDLRLIGALAVLMFTVIVVLHFVLP